MWVLKYEYAHSDCLYTAQAERLNITLCSYPINHFFQKNKLCLTAIHIVKGSKQNVEKYIAYLKKITTASEQISENILFTLVATKKNFSYYKAFYSPVLIYPTPIVHKDGKEHIHVASWDRSSLSAILTSLRRNKNTAHLKIRCFREEKLKEIFLMRAVPQVTQKQRQVFERAIQEGYYNYPRKINLDDLSRMLNMSKSNCHEILRRAEANILPHS